MKQPLATERAEPIQPKTKEEHKKKKKKKKRRNTGKNHELCRKGVPNAKVIGDPKKEKLKKKGESYTHV